MRILRLAVPLLAAVAVSACGFRLQGHTPLPERLARPYVDAEDRYTPLYAALRDALRAAGAEPAPSAAGASAVIRIHRDASGHEVLSVSARNTPSEFEVFYTVEYSVSDAAGEPLTGPHTVTLTRDFSYDEAAILAKEHEERSLRAALARELAGLVLRRLAAL